MIFYKTFFKKYDRNPSIFRFSKNMVFITFLFHQAREEAQDARDARAEANSEDFLAAVCTSGVPSFVRTQGSPISVEESTCASSQHDAVSPTISFRCSEAHSQDLNLTPGMHRITSERLRFRTVRPSSSWWRSTKVKTCSRPNTSCPGEACHPQQFC